MLRRAHDDSGRPGSGLDRGAGSWALGVGRAVERAVAERRAGVGLGHGGKTRSLAESWAARAVRGNWLGQRAGPMREKERAD